MTTIRRLVMELGVVGDQKVIGQLKAIDNITNNLSKRFETIENQFATIGSNITKSPLFSSGFPSPAITQKEQIQRNMQLQQMRESKTKNTQREQEQLNLSKKNVELQGKLISTISEELSKQQESFERMFEEGEADRKLFLNISSNMTQIVRDTLNFINKVEPQRDLYPMKERLPISKKGVKGFQPSVVTKRFGKELGSLTGKLDAIDKELDVSQQEFSKSGSVNAQEITERFANISKKVRQTVASVENGSMFDKQVNGEWFYSWDKTSDVKPFIPNHEVGPRTGMIKPTDSGKTAKLQKPKRGNFEERDMYDVISQLMVERGLESKNVMNVRSLQRVRIAANVMQRREKIKIASEVGRIESDIEEQLDHIDRIRERGFAFVPAEKMRDVGKRMSNSMEKFENKIKNKFVGFLTKRFPKLFKPADEFIEKLDIKEKAETESLLQELQKPAGQTIINNFNFQIDNPVVKDDEQAGGLAGIITNAVKNVL